MRLFSIIQWHHFAYMMISVALLGFGASGTFLSLTIRRLLRGFHLVYSINGLCFALSMVAGVLLAKEVPFNPLEILWDYGQWTRLLEIYLLLCLPFFFAANCIGLALSHFTDYIHRVYASDLLGAGGGALGIILLLYVLSPINGLKCLAVLAVAASAVSWLRLRGRPQWLVGMLAVIAVLLPFVLPGQWMAVMPNDYKGLSQALQVIGTHVIEQRSSPLGLITLVESPVIPFRHVPGLSLNTKTEPPPQLGIFTDGDALSVITQFNGDRSRLAYLDYVPSALPYHLIHEPRVLILGAGGGADVLQALYHGARQIDAVELNPDVIDLVQQDYATFAGGIYNHGPIRIHTAEARGYVAKTNYQFDLIQVALLDAFNASAAGLYALNESYLYTVEAIQAYLQLLNSEGMLAITRWVKLPPRDGAKLFATVVTALRQMGVDHPENQIMWIRGWQTSTLLVKNGLFSAKDIGIMRSFCDTRWFDVAYYPGMHVEEANQHNILDRNYFFEAASNLLSTARNKFIHAYKFDIAPATDDKPYFFKFFKWASLPELVALRGRGGLSMLELGYLVLVATLVQALLAGLVLILLPLIVVKRSGMISDGGWQQSGRVSLYFFAVGLAFLFIEIAFIQRFILFLSHPLYAISVVLTGFLIFAGLGSMFAGKHTLDSSIAGVLWPIGGIGLVALIYLIALPNLFVLFMPLPDVAKIAIALLLIAPLAFCMGMPFPMGLSRIAIVAPTMIPWAWGINGCASVISAVLATVLAIQYGFTMVIVLALCLYGMAAISYPCALARRGQPA